MHKYGDNDLYVSFGHVARHEIGETAEDARMYLKDPVLSAGIRWRGSYEDFHCLEIHRGDVAKFVDTVLTWKRNGNKDMKTQPKKTLEEVRNIVARVAFQDRTFRVDTMGNGYFLQIAYMEADVDTGVVELQKARKWYVSGYSTETEIVETAFKACRVSMEHVLKEHFTYKGRRVYCPHFDINARIQMCDEKRFDGRIPPPK